MKTIVEKWEGIGFLEEIKEDRKEQLANCFEEAANYLMSHYEDYGESCETYIFPVLYKLAKDSNLILNPIELIHEFHSFLMRPDILDTIQMVSNIFDGEAEVLNMFINEVKEKTHEVRFQ